MSAQIAHIDPQQYKELSEYSQLSGTPVDDLVYEALYEFIECAISARTEALARKTAQA